MRSPCAIFTFVTAAASLLLGVQLGTAVSASADPGQTPAGACAQQATVTGVGSTGEVDVAFKLAVCTDLVQDLIDIGQKLGMPVIRPTSSLTSPVEVIFDSEDDGDTLLATHPFVPGGHLPGLVGWEPCRVTLYPRRVSR